jgi:hypothetical protein
MAEPAPVVGNGLGGSCRTMGQLRLAWETSSEPCDELGKGQRTIKIEYYLGARTRFGMRIDKPESKASSDESRPHKRSDMTHLGTFEIHLNDMDNVRLESVANGRRCHTGTISLLIQIAVDTIPTFSHCLASRGYSLLVKVQVRGLQHKALSIRVPVQVCESVSEMKYDASRANSSIYGNILLSEVR